jgi:ABC-type lipoprotein export system ATPase subunit
VLLDGRDAWHAPESVRARTRNAHLGFVFQDANLLQGLTARENLVLPLLLRPRGGPDPIARADELLAAMGLAHKANTLAERLSGGERQRVATARALVGDPGLILVDEPTGNLDAVNATRITELLLEHQARTGATLFIASHDDRVVGRADRVLRLDEGRVHAAV